MKAKCEAEERLSGDAETSDPPILHAEPKDDVVMTEGQSHSTDNIPTLTELLSASSESKLRRQSTITLSSLKGTRHDSAFPLKLDIPALPIEDLIPGLFSPGTLARQTALPPASVLEAGPSFSRGIPELNTQDSGLEVVEHVHMDLTQDDHELTLTHEGSNMHDEASAVIGLSSIENLFGDIEGVTPGGSGQIDVEAHGSDEVGQAGKDLFNVAVQDVAGPASMQSTESVEIIPGVTDVIDRAEPMEVLADKAFGSNAGDLTLGADFGQADFTSLSPGIFESLDAHNPSQYSGDIDLDELDLANMNMTDLLGGSLEDIVKTPPKL